MLTQGTKELERSKRHQAMEKYNYDCIQYTAAQLRDAHLVADKNLSVANSERQMGKALGAKALQKELQNLNSRIVFKRHPWKPNAIVVCERLPDGIKELFPAENGMMPEWSILTTKEVTIPHNTRRYDGIPEKRTIPWREQTRGWRTILARLVSCRLLSIEQARKVTIKYGSEDRETWGAVTGIKGAKSPF